MPREETAKLYEDIKILSLQIGELKLPLKIIEALKQQDEEKANNIVEEFKQNNSELWEKIEKYGEETDSFEEKSDLEISKLSKEDYMNNKIIAKHDHRIFGDEFVFENFPNLFFKYDPSEIDPLNIVFLLRYFLTFIREFRFPNHHPKEICPLNKDHPH